MNGKIVIEGLIGNIYDEQGKLVEKGMQLIDVILQVKKQPNAESFDVYIKSEGGVVETGYEIYNYLKSLGKPIKTIGHELVGSIATVIFAVGQQRELKPGTVFHPHLPSGAVKGTSNDIQLYALNIAEAEKKMLKTYKEDVGLSEEEILPILTKDESITAEQAYGLGFANVKTELNPIVAHFNKQKPNKTMSKDKGIIAKMKAILNGLPITNKVVFDAEGKELDFYELEDGATIETGAKANVDGKAAEGEYLVQSEEDPEIVFTYVFEAGVLMEIKEPEAEPEDNSAEDEMTALKAEIETLKTQVQEITARKIEVEEENKTFKKAIMAIKKLETEKEPATATKFKQNPAAQTPKVNKVAEGITNLIKKRQ